MEYLKIDETELKEINLHEKNELKRFLIEFSYKTQKEVKEEVEKLFGKEVHV